jgi:hypothetical protein
MLSFKELYFLEYPKNSFFDSYDRILNLWRLLMMIALTIMPRHQLIFGVGGI